ncbi:MAG TPA: hypothetical protein VN176_18065 [Verrucomicrobiae bacterium]|jgi:hypothetical protein|nr:hypothetical protein [Verrucomicrobiae bacterium]
MNCHDVRENLIELLADTPDASALSDHVSKCKGCAQELESLRKTMSLLDEWEAPEPSPYFLTRLRANVKEANQERTPSLLLGWLRKPALAVSLATVLVAGGVMYQVLRPVGTPVLPQPGTAVGDLDSLDKNHDLFVNSDLLDEFAGLNQKQQQQPDE